MGLVGNIDWMDVTFFNGKTIGPIQDDRNEIPGLSERQVCWHIQISLLPIPRTSFSVQPIDKLKQHVLAYSISRLQNNSYPLDPSNPREADQSHLVHVTGVNISVHAPYAGRMVFQCHNSWGCRDVHIEIPCDSSAIQSLHVLDLNVNQSTTSVPQSIRNRRYRPVDPCINNAVASISLSGGSLAYSSCPQPSGFVEFKLCIKRPDGTPHTILKQSHVYFSLWREAADGELWAIYDSEVINPKKNLKFQKAQIEKFQGTLKIIFHGGNQVCDDIIGMQITDLEQLESTNRKNDTLTLFKSNQDYTNQGLFKIETYQDN
jgi:hypothetical protein